MFQTNYNEFLKIGTSHPVWANGSLPTVIGNYSTLMACVRNSKSCCADSWPIRVRKCSINSTTFFVYKLRPPPKCPMSYCAGNVSNQNMNYFQLDYNHHLFTAKVK